MPPTAARDHVKDDRGKTPLKQSTAPRADANLMGQATFRQLTKRTSRTMGLGQKRYSRHLDAIEEMLGRVREEAKDTQDAASSHAVQINLLDQIAGWCELWVGWHPDDEIAGTVTKVGTDAAAEAKRLRKQWETHYGTEAPKPASAEGIGEAYQGVTVYSGFEKLRPLLEKDLTKVGSRTDTSISVEIPVITEGTFVGFKGRVTAEKGAEDEVKIRAEVGVTGGTKAFDVAKVSGQLGGYMEAQGRDVREALRLLSYGLLRQARENSLVPHAFTNLMWGGHKGEKGFKLAELFSASVEQAMSGRAGASYVEVGVHAGAGASAEAPVLGEASASVQATAGARYDEAGIGDIGGRKGQWSDDQVEAITASLWAASGGKRSVKSVKKELAGKGHAVATSDLQRLAKGFANSGRKGEERTQDDLRGLVGGYGSHRRDFTALGQEAASPKEAARPRGEHVQSLKAGAEADTKFFGAGIRIAVEFSSKGRDRKLGHFKQAKLEGKVGVEIPGAADGVQEAVRAKTYELMKYLGKKAKKQWDAKYTEPTQRDRLDKLAKDVETTGTSVGDKLGSAFATKMKDAVMDKFLDTTCEVAVEVSIAADGKIDVSAAILEKNKSGGSASYVSAKRTTTERPAHVEWSSRSAPADDPSTK